MTRKILSILTTLIMAISLAGVLPALTASAETYSGICGENVTWWFDSSSGILTISGTGDMNDYELKATSGSVKYTAPWKNYDIKQVNIENGVTRIGSAAFNNCGGELKIPDSVTSIGDKAWVKWSFFNSPENESITIPKTVLKIGEKAFGYFRNTESVDDLVFEKITNFKIYCYAGTAGEKYAKDNGFVYEILPDITPNNTNKSNTKASKTKTAVKPAKVTKVRLTDKKRKLNVSWKKVSGATGYEVKAATNNKFTKNKKTVTVKKNKVTIKNLKPKKKYFVKVRAYKLANGKKYYGKWSKVVKKKIR